MPVCDNSQRPLIGVGVLVWRGEQLLLGKRITDTQQSCWQFPGGHLENGESVIACARREVQEETGLAITAPRHLGFTDKSFNLAGRSYITLLVSAESPSGEPRVREPDKCEHWQWFDYQQLPSPLFKPIEIFLSQQAGLYRMHQSSVILSD
jgi:8-oxo-dGTP diphosphatase